LGDEAVRRVQRLVTVEIEQALGPGIDFERDRGAVLVGRRVRAGGAWLGFDRGALVDSDDGLGRRVPVLVALPTSTFTGARLEVELCGGWSSKAGTILVGTPPGGPTPVPSLALIAGGLDERATWFDREAAALETLRAHQRYREREGHARISGGRAWHPFGALPPEVARFATPHSSAEYSLARLPPRFLRGLEGLLDDDERILYWIERPMLTDLGIVRRLRGRVDRRAALLALTDRQLLWIVDHAQPDRYLSDWGVDVESVPVERVLAGGCAERGESVELTVTTPAGIRRYGLPIELRDEVRVMRDLIERFAPDAAGSLPRRRYELEAIAFDPETAARFGQEADARRLRETALGADEVLAFLFAPRRPGHRLAAALILRPGGVELASADRRTALELGEVLAISLTLSPLVGRLSFGARVGISYPAPLVDRGSAFVRLARKAIANRS
jgi:hypothetical protein